MSELTTRTAAIMISWVGGSGALSVAMVSSSDRSGALGPGVDVFAIVVPATADLRVATFDASGPGSCVDIDTVLTLIGTNGATVLAIDDDGGVDACSRIDRERSPGAAHLAAGAYYARVASYDGDRVIPGYTLVVTLDAICGDGLVGGAEECDGGEGCTATCDRVPVCGDGLLDAPEQCDDENAIAGDGCSPTCAFETTGETEPNDGTATAGGPFAPDALITGAITPRSDVDTFAITLTAIADLDVETFDGAGPGSCSGMDSVITLYGSDGATVITSADDGGIGSCSRIDPAIDRAARHLAAGTYFLKVEDFHNNTVIPAYTLRVRTTARCGDGAIEGSEECDGGAGCTAACERVAICGDGFVDDPETCDDANSAAGDGCDATCRIESIAEVEPNDDPVTADAAPVTITGDTLISGAVSPAGDVDVFAMKLAHPSVIRLETFDASGAECSSSGSIQTTMRLWDSLGAELYTDDNSGVFTCSALVVALPAGSYRVSVAERTGSLPIAAYLLQAKIEARVGVVSESEPNDVTATATSLPGSDVVVHGDHAACNDSDLFAITVPEGRSLRAEIVEGDAETCESDDVDSLLTLLDPNGVALGDDDDSGRGFCSRIDGTSTTPAEAYAHALAAGTYYLLVEASPSARSSAATSAQFAYTLAITLR